MCQRTRLSPGDAISQVRGRAKKCSAIRKQLPLPLDINRGKYRQRYSPWQSRISVSKKV